MHLVTTAAADGAGVVSGLSGPLWMLLMFGAALLFAYLRKASGSAAAARRAMPVQLAMNVTIFAFLWAPGPESPDCMQPDSIRKDASKALMFAALSLFAVPLGAFLFTEHAQSERDAMYTEVLLDSVDRDTRIPAEEKQNARAFFAAQSASSACDDDSADLAEYRAMVCEPDRSCGNTILPTRWRNGP